MNSDRIDANAETSFHSPHIDIPEGVKLAAASSFDQIKDRLAKLQANLEVMTGALGKSSSTAMTDTSGLHMKMFEAVRTNLMAGFEFAGELAAAKSFPEILGASSRFAHRQFDAFTAQWKDFGSFGQKMLADAARPVASGLSRGIGQAASS